MSGAGSRPHVVEVEVRYAETDQMGRAHHGVYVVWCELGRTMLMREHGVSYAEMERSGVLLPVTGLEIEYRAAAYYEERVQIRTKVLAVRSRSVTFGYEVRGPGDRLLARARTDLACIDREGRTRRLPDDVRAALAAAESCR
ncbi:MAG: acyl-CoA thioesterase [Gemmatimonadota bacterium]|jgi:acyl-CoA thioester hydrolase|nr:MAG: acyl-CoA thioesterase [Gemmatimonadota bacterium]